MAQDRSRRGRGSRGRDQYGWGVPIRGMYNRSLDYGSLSGPETDSETVPGYDTEPGDWTGPRPRYEQRHWAAREPSYREGYGLRWRERPGPERPRHDRFEEVSRSEGQGRGSNRGPNQGERERGRSRGGPGFTWPDRGGLRPETGRRGFRAELGGMTPAHERDPWWGRAADYEREYRSGPERGLDLQSPGWTAYGREYRPAASWGDRPESPAPGRHWSRRDEAQARGPRERHDRDYPRHTLARWEEEWERNRGRGFHGDSDFEAYDREFRRPGAARRGAARPGRPGPG